SKGADVNFTAPSTGFTALTGAVSQRHARIADVLVRHGAQVNHVYEGSLTPLLVATSGGDLNVVRLLLDHGADPNLGAIEGKSALDIAKEKGSREIAEVLRQHGATRWVPAAPAEPTSPAAADPKTVLEKVRRAMNAHDLEGLLALIEPEYESEQPAHPDRAFQGREQVRKDLGSIFGRVPDRRADIVPGVCRGVRGGTPGGAVRRGGRRGPYPGVHDPRRAEAVLLPAGRRVRVRHLGVPGTPPRGGREVPPRRGGTVGEDPRVREDQARGRGAEPRGEGPIREG